MSALAAAATPFQRTGRADDQRNGNCAERYQRTPYSSGRCRTQIKLSRQKQHLRSKLVPTSIALPSTPFTFKSPHASAQASLHVSRGMVPSQSLHNMQSLHPNGPHATALARPASAAADLGLHSPAVAGSAANLLSGPPTPHTPMRLFRFNYDDAITRAKLEQMVNEKTPAPAQQPSRLGDLERERKRLRLDVKPRKVLTGDLMSMPMLGEPGPSQMPSESQPQAQP